MEQKLAAAEKEVLEELVKEVQRQGMRGENGGLKEFLAVYDKTFGASMSDPSRRSHDVLVAFLGTFKQKDYLLYLRRYANSLFMKKFKQLSADNETPEQSLVRKTIEHPTYSLEYSFYPRSEGWLVSDAGMKLSKLMLSTKMVAVDCEMVLCEGGTEGLVRVDVVDRDLKVILNEFVKPDKRVVDYRTAITGVTAEHINRATISLEDVQEKIVALCFIGCYFVLQIAHTRVIDTSYLFKYLSDQKQRRPSLNNLCRSMLGYEVQKAGVSHDCVHDAAAAMRLVLALIEKRIDTTIRLSKEPAKQLGGYYCAVVVFNSPKEAEQAFRNVDGIQEKDSHGLRQKLVRRTSSFYVRKMVKDE